jgi:hypothetical protein
VTFRGGVSILAGKGVLNTVENFPYDPKNRDAAGRYGNDMPRLETLLKAMRRKGFHSITVDQW